MRNGRLSDTWVTRGRESASTKRLDIGTDHRGHDTYSAAAMSAFASSCSVLFLFSTFRRIHRLRTSRSFRTFFLIVITMIFIRNAEGGVIDGAMRWTPKVFPVAWSSLLYIALAARQSVVYHLAPP
jgi:hypothetical protein